MFAGTCAYMYTVYVEYMFVHVVVCTMNSLLESVGHFCGYFCCFKTQAVAKNKEGCKAGVLMTG